MKKIDKIMLGWRWKYDFGLIILISRSIRHTAFSLSLGTQVAMSSEYLICNHGVNGRRKQCESKVLDKNALGKSEKKI